MIDWLRGDGPKTVIKRILLLGGFPTMIIELIINICSPVAPEGVAPPAGYVVVRVATRYTSHYAFVRPWVAELQHWVMEILFAVLAAIFLLAFAVFFAQNRDTRPMGATVRIPTPPPEER